MESVSKLKESVDHLKKEIERKNSEIERLKARTLFFQTLFDKIEYQVVVIDEDHTIHDVNQIFLENYALQKEHALGKKCYQLIHQLEKPCSYGGKACPLVKARETGESVEVIHRHRDTKRGYREMMHIIYPLPAVEMMPRYFVEISRDITNYRNLITRLKTSEKKIRAILDTATDAILSINAAHKIILFNNAAEKIFGYTRREVIGKDLNLLIPPQYGDHHTLVKRFLDTKDSKIMGKALSLTALRKGGEEFPIELGLSYHEVDGEITFTAIIRDVTEQKELEKKLLQSERLAAVGRTVAHVAHEIKNPLMIIGGFSHQIKKKVTNDKTIKKLDMILDEVNRLERLVANLGDFTKEYKLVKRSADINSVILDVLKIMEGIYEPTKYGFNTELSPDLNEITCDPDKLKQVFMNIIANGVEAMENGGVITVGTREWINGVEIRIHDNGIGISEKDLLHIFEPFYTTRERGSGLGLAISYRIVEAHKGEIRTVSKPGEGTTFIITLPSG